MTTKRSLRNIESDELVLLVKANDTSAFDELVRRHRPSAFRVAQSILSDAHLADDVTQESLLQAYIHLDQLQDPQQFGPWLNKIVRNQALMKLRSHKGKGKEIPISFFSKKEEQANVDQMAYLSTKGMGQLEHDSNLPLEQVVREEMKKNMYALFECLTETERPIFEAFVFKERSVAEIAAYFQLEVDYVYKIISRSRKKLTAEKTRTKLQRFIKEHLDNGGKRMKLPYPRSTDWSQSKNTFALGLYYMINHFSEQRITLADVLGLSTQAFRITIKRETVAAQSSKMYYWEPIFSQGINNLGFTCTYVGDGGVSPSPYLLKKGIEFIQQSIQQGDPVMCWGIGGAEFGIIYGFDQDKQCFFVDGIKGCRTITYDQLGRSPAQGLFLLTIHPQSTVDQENVRQSLLGIVQHAKSERTFTGYVSGLAAYGSWMEALKERTADVKGHDENIALLLDARSYAVNYLNGISARISGEPQAFCDQAVEKYRNVLTVLHRLQSLRAAKSSIGEDNAFYETGYKLLEQAKQEEEAGVEQLLQLCRYFSAGSIME